MGVPKQKSTQTTRRADSRAASTQHTVQVMQRVVQVVDLCRLLQFTVGIVVKGSDAMLTTKIRKAQEQQRRQLDMGTQSSSPSSRRSSFLQSRGGCRRYSRLFSSSCPCFQSSTVSSCLPVPAALSPYRCSNQNAMAQLSSTFSELDKKWSEAGVGVKARTGDRGQTVSSARPCGTSPWTFLCA